MVALKGLLKLVKRQQPIVLGSACYAACNYANMVWQSVHLVTSLCDYSGPFATAMFKCESCASKHTATAVMLTATWLVEPLSYCSSHGVTDLTEQIALSQSSACASYTSIGELGPASLDCTLTLTDGSVQSWAIVINSASDIPTATLSANSTSSLVPPATVTAYITQSIPTATSVAIDQDRPSTGTIAGIAVGATLGVVFVLGLIVFSAWRVRRKRMSREQASPTAMTANPTTESEKPQLHSDDYRPNREELEGSKVPLQVREIAGLHEIEHQGLSRMRTELSANEIVASELDSPGRVRLSPTAESSTLLGSSVRSEGG